MSQSAKAQVERLLALVPYLRERDGVRLEHVAADFGVSVEQLSRDLRVLWFCGLPGAMPGDLIDVDIEALEGEGVVHIDNADYLDRPLRLDTHEALALIVALRTLRDVGGPAERDAVARALAKLEQAAGGSLAAADQVEVRIDASDATVADTVHQALHDQRRLRIDYLVPARDESTTREVDPLRLVVSEGRRYLEAWCYRVQGQRLFRLDRIDAAALLDVPADPPRQARPRDLSEGLFQASADQMLATVDLDPSARWVVDYYPHEGVEELPGGGLRMRLRVSEPAWLRRLVLRLGGAARVVSPADIAEQVRDEARRALAAYDREPTA
ncbi:MAG TPA: YafY family protein [Nocardioidaceae bacterium]|nr:YafY family protein [Nocardioidaceae bacterium]